MDDDVWLAARTKAYAAERKPGMTPKRRGLAKLLVDPLAAVIAGKIADKRHLPHGRLGALLQVAEPRELAIIALEAIAPQLWRTRRKAEARRDLKLAIGDTFYANVTLAKAAKDARGNKDALRTLRWRR